MKKDLVEIAILIIVIVAIVLIYYTVAQSDLPLWIKFLILK